MAAKNMCMCLILILCLALAHTSNAIWGGLGFAICSCTCRLGCSPIRQYHNDDNGGQSCSCTCDCPENAFLPPVNPSPKPPSSPPPPHHRHPSPMLPLPSPPPPPHHRQPSPMLPLPPPLQTPSPKLPTPTPSPPKTLPSPFPPQDAFPTPNIPDLIVELSSCVDSFMGIIPCYLIAYGSPQYIDDGCCQVFRRNKECLALTQFGLPFSVRQTCRV